MTEAERAAAQAIFAEQVKSYEARLREQERTFTAIVQELEAEKTCLNARIQELESQVQFMKGKHDTALDLYTMYHNDNVKLRNELHDIAAQRDVLAAHLSCCAYFNVEAHTPSEWIELAKEAVKKEDSK